MPTTAVTQPSPGLTRQGKRFVLEVDRPGVKNQPHSVIDEPLAFKFPALGRNTVAIVDQDGRFIGLGCEWVGDDPWDTA